MASEPRYLLLVACSQRKRATDGLMPAIDRYDGVNFRVLRKARREGYWPANVDLLILSAKYGLLKADSPIEHYDLRLTREHALAMQARTSADLDKHLINSAYREVFVNIGQTYLVALARSRELSRQKVSYATGSIGEMMSQMKQWLIRTSCDAKQACS